MWEKNTRIAPLIKLANNLGIFKGMRAWKMNTGSITILLHGTYGKQYSHVPGDLHFGMHGQELERMLIWIKEHKMPVISYEDYLNKKNGLHITMDDGYANNYDVALPLFEKYNMPVTIFVTTRHIIENGQCNVLDYFKDKIKENKAEIPDEIGYELFYGLTTSQIKELSSHPLVTLGGHTHNHPHLDICSKEQIVYEIEENIKILSSITGQKVLYFAYPFGDYNQVVIDTLKEFGILHAYAVVPKLKTNPGYEDPRIGIYYADDHYLSAKLNFFTKH